MENDTTLAKEGLLEPVLPGSETFDNSILAPLQNNYLYEESKEFFTYSSAHLINNATLQKRYSAFRAEKQEKGYSDKDLQESFGFLLFDDESTANKLADTGLMVGHGTCTTLGDSSKGVYISKYSDCLDLKRWYDGKTGYIVILKLTKGRVKEVTENYTQNFTRPTAGFDCHVSEQLRAVCTTTSSFLAFERTQYYMYELLDRGRKAAQCPRHVCPFAIVAFSYGKATISDLELKEKSQEKKTSFHYQPWSGQLKIESVVYDVGLKSINGAIFPANLSKTVKVAHAIGVSELRKTLPQAVFETSVVGEVCLDGRSFSLYDVVSLEARNDLSVLTQELKEKDMALVVCLDDGGFLILLHSSHFLSYEGAGTDKASTLQGMFIFPDSRSVPRETKRGHVKPKVSPETLQVLPALNYAESEMEKCPSNQQGEPLGTVEKHLQNFATLILPGLSSSPVREASMFPDQYDVPDGFPLIAPKWTEVAGARLKTYLENPCGFQIPVARALELLAAGKQQRNDDHDDDVFYYISSPEEAPQTPADTSLERDVTDEADHISGSNSVSDEVKATGQNQKDVAAEPSHSASPEEGGTPGTVVMATSDSPCERTDPSPKSGDVPERCNNAVTDSEKMSQSASDQIAPNDECSESPEAISKETSVETTSVPLTESGTDFSAVATKASLPCEAEAEGDTTKKEDCRSDVPPKDEDQIPVEDKEVPKEAGLPTSISVPTLSENQTEAVVEDCKKVQPEENSDILPQTKRNMKRLARRRGKRKKRGLRRNVNKGGETPASVESTSLPSCSPVDATPEQSGNSEVVCSSTSDLPKKDWRSLPRRKRFWNVDVSLKRVLRSDAKSSETESLVEESPSVTEPSVTGIIMTSTPKRKMEGFSMRERYGLKTIITECGRVFVPHGSDVATGDVKSKETNDSQDSSLVTTSPASDKLADTPITPSPSTHIQDIPMNTPVKALSPQHITEKDTTSHNNSGQSLDSDPKKSKPKENVYKAISISKLKTVLKRAKRSRDNGKSATENAEPELKKGRSNTDVDLTPDDGKLSPRKDTKDKSSSVLQKDPELADKQDPSKSSQFKQSHVSWRELKTSSSQEKLMPKENGLSGVCPQAPPPAGCVESLLSLNPKLQLKLPEHSSGAIGPDKGGKNGWRHLSLDMPPPSSPKAKMRKPKFLHQRRIIEREGSIQVGRLWRESYDFTYDSRFTNDRLEKSVTRALHGKWDFSIEDTYEQVHLIFHMWIGLFYSKPTSRFFHFDHNSTLLERKDPPKVPDVISPVQASPPVSDAGLSSKEDETSPLRPVSDILDLSVKVPGPSDHCIVSQGSSGESPKTSSDTGSRVEQRVESKEPADGTSLSHSSKVPTKLSAVNYRSTGDHLEESSVSDHDYSDMDNDAGTESSYTKLLENNSAYSHLCEQASNMCIGEQKCLKVPKTVLVSKDQGVPEALRIRNPARVASGKITNFDPKAVAVFHQVVRPVGPVILSNARDQASERKIILSSLSFKDKTGDGAPESRHSESVSRDKGEIALPGKNVHSGNNKDESALKTVEASSSASSMAVCTENDNAEMEVKSVLVSRDETSISIQKANDSTKEKVSDDTLVPVDMHGVVDVSDKARKEVEPMSVDKPTHDSRNDATERINTDKTNEKGRPVAEVRSETPVVRGDMSRHDMKNETPHGVCNMSDERMPKDGVKPVHDVNDGKHVDVQDGNDNAKDGVKTTRDIGDGTPVKDVNDQTKEEARASTSVSERHDDKVEDMEVHEVIDADDIKENVLEKSEKSACEEITGNESNESEKREGAQIMGDDTNSKKDSEQKIVQSHASALEQDLADSVDMKICDEKKSEDETQAQVNEVNVSGGEAGVKDIVKPLEGEVRAETSVVRNDGEHISDDAQLEGAPDSSADCVGSSSQQFMKMKEGQSSPAVGATCSPTENNSESTIHSPVVQNETPVINQAEPKRACADVSPCDVVTNTEPCVINESSHWDSTKAADDLAISKATLTKEVDSSKDIKSQEKDTNQNRLTSTISKAPVGKTSEIHHDSDSQDMSPPALQIDMEHELNSRSCTPTQDELPYDYKACEDLEDNHSFERELHPVNRSPTVKGSAPDRSVCPLSCPEKHICNSPGHGAQSFPQDTCRSARKFDTTVKVNDESESPLISEHVPKQNLRHFEHEDLTPPRHLYSKESRLQKDQFGHMSEEYEEQSSKLLSSWTHGPSFKTDEPDTLREPFACVEDAEGPLIHFRNNTSIHRELAQMPREATDSDSDGWVRHFRCADSVSAVDESNERVFPFRHQADLSLSESYDTDGIRHSRKKLKRTFYQDTWDQEDFEGATEYSIKKTFSCGADRTRTLRTVTSSSYQHKGESKQSFDWRRYFRREGIFDTSDENDRFARDPPSSIITVFDKKGNRAIFENTSTLKRSVGTHGVNLTVEDPLHNWEDQRSKSDITQSLMELEYLIFSEKMNQMLKNCKAGSIAKTQHRPNLNPADNPMTVQFSKLDEQESSVRFDETWPTHTKFKINVDMSERKVMREVVNYGKPLHLRSLFCERGDEAACTKISDITKECAKSYNTMMNDVCIGKTTLRQHDKTKRKRDVESAASSSKQSAFCGRIKKAMFDNLHDNLNSIVRQACKIKYKFYILVTSADPFFEETKDLLEAEGHAAVEPYQFDFDDNDQTPLLIILRNEDIAEHICDVPHLLDLKKSSRVLFAGIDQPDDVVNLTHQELFAKGGFVVFDDTALDTLTLENMKKVVGIMEELDKKGKWKWFLHYRDSRKLRENARCSPEAQTRKHFMDCCQEAGIVEVLPYHECDVISRDRPDYLRCLVRLQIQNASARFPVFITDTPAESFGKNGILTMNIYTFSRILSNDTCSVS
ncbi:uncharacterized protein tasor2 isoform X2 [Colossoma macropomum]|uniref:uncharacterized protein tasor2 isoform X2 n=1 Tax=Colossoma macropomum TaxID=42526 RepID=UPI001863AEDC|nr:uncharacterized protein tasor2 isoform X2 [Colossoma macropomum]